MSSLLDLQNASEAICASPAMRRIQTMHPERRRNGGTAAARRTACAAIIFIFDLISFATSGLIGGLLLSGPPAIGREANVAILPLVGCVLLAALAMQGRYHQRMPFWAEMRAATVDCVVGCAALGLVGVLMGLPVAPAMIALLVFPALAAAANRLAKIVLVRAGLWTTPVLLVGDGNATAQAEAILAADPLRGYRIVGRADADAVMTANEPGLLAGQLARHGADRALIAVDGDGRQQVVVAQALRERVDFSVVVPNSVLPAFECETLRPFGCDATLLLPRPGHRHAAARVAKAVFDIAVAAILLAILAPALLIIALLIRRDGGPALYAHRRIGSGGRSFACLKFRTMVVNGDAVLADALARDPTLASEWAAKRKLTEDPRVTPIGRLLRKTSLDELPQLLNVLCLQMSLVGPRPIVPSEVPFYGEDIAHYYAGRPGLTGLWQVSGRSNTTYQRRVQLDVWYVNNWTLWSDLLVLLKTVPAVLAGDGAT